MKILRSLFSLFKSSCEDKSDAELHESKQETIFEEKVTEKLLKNSESKQTEFNEEIPSEAKDDTPANLYDTFPYYDSEYVHFTLDNAKKLNTDLLEADYPEPASDIEAKYRGRIFSISGKDKRFPQLPKDIFETRLGLYPFIFGISEPLYCPPGQEIAFSNRPFVDDRDQDEIQAFDAIIKEVLRKAKNEKDYAWILNNLPDLAPKSLSGYSRMRNSNSANFIKIKKAAAEKGYEI